MRQEIEEFMSVKSRYLSKRSVLTYRRSLEVFAQIVAKPLGSVRDADIAHAVEILSTRFRDTTVQNVMNVVHTFFKFWGAERECLSHERIHVPQAVSVPRYSATEEDFEAILAVIDKDSFRGDAQELTFKLLWYTGMRIGELASLRLEHVDLHAMKAIVRTEKTKAFRHVFWGEETQECLLRYMQARESLPGEFLLTCPTDSHRRVDRLSTRAIERWLKELCKKAGIKHPLVPHSFRHSRIQRWFAADLNPYEVIMLTGHRSIMSLTHYMRLNHPKTEANARRGM